MIGLTRDGPYALMAAAIDLTREPAMIAAVFVKANLVAMGPGPMMPTNFGRR